MGTKRPREDDNDSQFNYSKTTPKNIVLRACKRSCDSLAETLASVPSDQSAHCRWKWSFSRELMKEQAISGWLTRSDPPAAQSGQPDRASHLAADQQETRDRFPIVLTKPVQMQHDMRSKVFALFERNMRAHYEGADGWDAEDKQSELFHDDSRFICIFERGIPEEKAETRPLVGFLMFRFDLEDCTRDDRLFRRFSRVTKRRKLPVLYCYELQVDSKFQSLGLGSALVQAMQVIGAASAMVKCMLTVFKSNEDAKGFYDRCGYERDGICPKEEESASYEILSRPCVSS